MPLPLASAAGLLLMGFVGLVPAQAQSIREECSQKYQAAKAGDMLNGRSWTQFFSQCAHDARVGSSGTPTPEAVAAGTPAAPAAPAAPANPLKPATPPAAPKTPPVPAVPAAPAAAPSAAVFPSAISAKYQAEKPAKARMHTCLDQYNANKETNANGGLKWIITGGGYYSECNKRLKGM
ncbi:hypothetical protein [Beijerinckia indica]|nr:hypothetical protein [Beijerinckia indica]